MEDIKFDITADNRFSRTFATLKNDLRGAGDQVDRITGLASRATVALGAIGGVPLLAGAAIRRFADDLDALNDASDAVGDTVENVSALFDVARRNGGTADLATSALLRLNKVLAEATPESAISKELQRIGLDAQALKRAAPTEALREVAVALNGYANDGERARVQTALLGRSTRELASFLKDYAEAGNVAATVTAAQAAEAEKFNKQLAALSTNAGNAARSITASLLPLLNQDLARLTALKDTFGGFFTGAAALVAEGKRFEDAGAGVAFYTQRLADLQRQRDIIAADPNPVARRGGLIDVDAELARARQLQAFYRQVFTATAPDLGQSSSTELARRGRAPLGSIGPEAAATKAAQTEAERLLETLRKQGQAYDEMTASARLVADIEAGRIQGLTPAIEKQLRLAAQEVDTRAQLKAEAEQVADLEKARTAELQRQRELYQQGQRFLADSRRTLDADLAALRAQTSGAQAENVANQMAAIRQRLQDPEVTADEANQWIEVMERLKESLEGVGDTGKTEFDRLLDAVDGFAKGTTDALVDLATGGGSAVGDLFKAFRRDLLRALIEEPVRESMREVVKSIRGALGELGKGGGLFEALRDVFKGLGGGGGGGGGGALSGLLSLFSGFGTRASGGPVKAGNLYRWQENGREWMVPTTDGQVVNEGQARRAAAAAGGGNTYTFPVIVQGDASEQTIALIQAAQAQFAARLGLQG